MSNKQVVKAAATDVAVRPDISDLYLEDAGSGLENITTDDLAIPRLRILQALSPELDRTKPVFVPGAKAGDIFNSVTNRFIDGEKGAKMVFVYFRSSYLQWWPRDSRKGKGFIADHGPNPGALLTQVVRNDKNQDILPDGSELIKTAEYFAFVINEDGTYDRVLIDMSKTQLFKSKRLNTIITSYMIPGANGQKLQAPMFYRFYNVKTKAESNDKGSWMGWDISAGDLTETLPDGSEIYKDARTYMAAARAGQVKVATPDAPVATEQEPM